MKAFTAWYDRVECKLVHVLKERFDGVADVRFMAAMMAEEYRDGRLKQIPPVWVVWDQRSVEQFLGVYLLEEEGELFEGEYQRIEELCRNRRKRWA